MKLNLSIDEEGVRTLEFHTDNGDEQLLLGIMAQWKCQVHLLRIIPFVGSYGSTTFKCKSFKMIQVTDDPQEVE